MLRKTNSRYPLGGYLSRRDLSAVDEGYMKDLKEIHEKPDDKFDVDLATEAEKTRKTQQALWIVSFTDERKGTATGENCGRL